MATDPSLANETTANAQAWGGFAPFVAAAFALNKQNQASTAQQQQQQQATHLGKLSVPGGGGKMPINAAPVLTANGVPGPLAPPTNSVNNGMPAALQAGPAGPMPGVTLPATPQVDHPTAPANHFLTGTPNPFGIQSLGY